MSIVAERKEKLYVSDNAQLMAEWDWEKNHEFGLDPQKLTFCSGRVAWWKCLNGHKWESRIADRNKGKGCPYCSGRYAISGVNDLATINPTIAEEWNYKMNDRLTPENVLPNSHKKVWWICEKGHEYQAFISDRNKGSGCPYCSGRLAIKGENDLLTINPSLASEWNHERNGNFTPKNILPNSNKKVWWRCKNGHEWQAVVSSRNKGAGCPYCAGQLPIAGYNDLQTSNPFISKEWNYAKNNGLTPADVMPNSNISVWWICKKGHEWQATIYHRNNGQGCPACNSESHTSFPEYAIVYYLTKYNCDVVHLYKDKGYELDIYIPSKKTAIEYDGYFWHKNKDRKDLLKNHKCLKDGITLYRIREGLPPLNDTSIDFVVQERQDDLSFIIQKMLSEILEIAIDVDLVRDYIDIQNLREFTEKHNSLSAARPDLAKEWNYKKNEKLKPEHCTYNSGKRVWWRCSNGHEWQDTIAHRSAGRGCPYCSGKKVLIGYNDLLTVNPAISKEWHFERNADLKPNQVTANSGKKVWWECCYGHEWQATIDHRSRGQGCPYCSGRYAVSGVNDLATINPLLANEWNYARNGELTPSNVLPNSGKKVWWKCSQGHEWQAQIQSRNRGCGCPKCAKQKRQKKDT